MKNLLAVSLALLGLCGVAATPTAQASPCGVVHFPHAYAAPTVSYAHNVYHNDYENRKRIVVLEYQLIPAFPIGYAAPAMPAPVAAAPAAATPCETRAALLEERLKALEAKLAGQGAATPATPSKSLIVNKCAACHDAKVSETKGGKLTLTQNGALIALTPEVVGKILKQSSQGKMPPDNKLTDQEFNTLLQDLVDHSSK